MVTAANQMTKIGNNLPPNRPPTEPQTCSVLKYHFRGEHLGFPTVGARGIIAHFTAAAKDNDARSP